MRTIDEALDLLGVDPDAAVASLREIRARALDASDADLAFSALAVLRVALGVIGDGPGELDAVLQCAVEKPTFENVAWAARELHARRRWSQATKAYKLSLSLIDSSSEWYELLTRNAERCEQLLELENPPLPELTPERAVLDTADALVSVGDATSALNVLRNGLNEFPQSERIAAALARMKG